MIIRVEIDSQTKAGRKVYELIQNLRHKDGITFITEWDTLTDEEIKALKKELIQLIDAEQKKKKGGVSLK